MFFSGKRNVTTTKVVVKVFFFLSKVKEKRKRGCKSCPFILYLIFDKAHKKQNKKYMER